MKVYRVNTFAKPPGTKYDYYAQLDCKKSDKKLLANDHFRGRPFPGKWRPVKLYFSEPLWPRADFYHLGLSNFVCTERVKALLGALMAKTGEFLPVSIEGEKGTHYIYNVTNCRAFLDPMRSIWDCDLDSPEELQNPTSALLAEPAFDSLKIVNESIFMIPQEAKIYSVERKDDPSKDFRSLVENHKLSGLRFDLAWSEDQGPVPEHTPPTREDGSVWLTGDGKKYKRKRKV